MMECYTPLCACARTKTVKLGAMVGGVTYRNPALLAKEVTTLDVISSGRAIWAIGAGWYEVEHDGYGYEFGTFTERFEKLEEALQIVKSMFVNDTTTLRRQVVPREGRAERATARDAGVGRPSSGGSGEKKTLRIVAQYADACNVFWPAPRTSAGSWACWTTIADGRARSGRGGGPTGTLVVGRSMEEAEGSGALQAPKLTDLPEDTQANLAADAAHRRRGGDPRVGTGVSGRRPRWHDLQPPRLPRPRARRDGRGHAVEGPPPPMLAAAGR